MMHWRQKRRPKWTDADLQSILRKLAQAKVDGIPFRLTEAEMMAHIEYMREKGERSQFAR